MLSPPDCLALTEFVSSRESGQTPAAVRIGFEYSCKYGHACRIKCSHTCLRWTYNRTNVGLLCCVGSGSNVAVPLDVGLRPLACSNCWFESRRGHGWSVCCDCCVSPGRGLCDELIMCPEESYRPWCVVVCVIYKPQNWEVPGPLGGGGGGAGPQKKA